MKKATKFILLICLPLLLTSCNDDDFDSVDYDKRLHNSWATATKSSKTYQMVFELNESGKGKYYMTEAYIDDAGELKTKNVVVDIISFKYTKSFGLDIKIEKYRTPYLYLEKMDTDSATFIENRYTATTKIVKYYTQDYLESLGYTRTN